MSTRAIRTSTATTMASHCTVRFRRVDSRGPETRTCTKILSATTIRCWPGRFKGPLPRVVSRSVTAGQRGRGDRASIIGDLMHARSGIQEGLSQLLGQRKQLDIMDVYEPMHREFRQLNAA
jgi:hypothetical protein